MKAPRLVSYSFGILLSAIVYLIVFTPIPKAIISMDSLSDSSTANSATNPGDAASTTTFEKVDSHLSIDNTLRDVNFCGTHHKMRRVLIDGFDVGQKIAQIGTLNLIPNSLYADYGKGKWEPLIHDSKDNFICDMQNNGGMTDNPIQIDATSTPDPNRYLVSIQSSVYLIFIDTDGIFTTNDFDGSTVGPIGYLK